MRWMSSKIGTSAPTERPDRRSMAMLRHWILTARHPGCVLDGRQNLALRG
jgi:hypothetical protein